MIVPELFAQRSNVILNNISVLANVVLSVQVD